MSEPGSAADTQVFAFDDFEIDLASFALRGTAGEISLEPQVLSLLAYFVQHPDVLVTKDELLDELWGHRYVSDSAVATQIKTLRKALGDDGRNQRIIKTVHGKGYRFAVPVHQSGQAQQPIPAPRHQADRTSNLGYERTKLIGRGDELSRCIAALDDYRLVTLLGIGGTGKTRLAKAVGRAVQDRYPDGVWFVDLVPVRDRAGIDTAIASVMGISVNEGESRTHIAAAVRNSKVLFILDNCEHIEDDVAAALDFYLEHTEAPDFLATSRDPIDLADELRFFIDPLSVHSEQGIAPAVELFLLTAERHGLTEQSPDVARVEQICEHLDGLPLAIELAAAQLKQLTLDELSERLDRRFELLAGRQREGSHRQESLARVVENTWDLLDSEEQRLLGQLAVFPGQFTVTDIEEVFADELPNGISFAMSRLVELCLLSRTSRVGAWWRLLETVRLFALEKLSDDERQGNSERHAQWVLQRLGKYPEDHLHSLDQARWSADHYSDITAAELYFEGSGRRSEALEICCAVGLMIQQDDGARANAKLKRIEHYLADTTDTFELSKLHGTAALCAQVTRNPLLLARESEINLELCREVGDHTRLAGALILTSLTNIFMNPELGRAQLAEAIEVAEASGHQPTLDLVMIYQIWSHVMEAEFDTAIDKAESMISRHLSESDTLRNPTYNAICALMACHIFAAPVEAERLADDLMERNKSYGLWGAMILIASVYASSDRMDDAIRISTDIEARLRRAGRSPWPDLLIPPIAAAYRRGETELATTWLNAVRASRKPQQTFHTISVYRQLRRLLPSDGANDELDLDSAGQQALSWMREIAAEAAPTTG